MTMRARASWDEYFMAIARVVATRSTCDRKHVGAVIVREKMILTTGYNGSIRGLEHCDDVGHLMEEGHCVRTVHAEANAIVQATTHFDNPALLAEVSKGLGAAMRGISMESIPDQERLAVRGW